MFNPEILFILFLIIIAALGLQLLGKLVLKSWHKRSHAEKSRGA